MGLLERALKYKQQINLKGKETLIDKIKGPAETDYSQTIKIKDIDEQYIGDNDIIENINQSTLSDVDDLVITNEQLDEEIVLLDDFEISSSMEEISTDSKKLPDSEIIEPLFINNNNEFSESDADKKIISERTIQNQLENHPEDKLSYEMPEINDYSALYEIQKELMDTDSIENVYSTILFSIMGQLGVSSASVLAPSKDDENIWKIVDSHGIKISDEDLFWKLDEGILQLLNNYKGILDIEDLKNDSNLRDDYYKFTAVDARIICPLIKNENIIAALLVGEKINSEEYSPGELEFLQALTDIAATIINLILKHEKLTTELLGLRIEQEILSDVEYFQDSLLITSSISDLKDIMKKNFYSLGVEGYALFANNELTYDYFPLYYDETDILNLGDSGFKIKKDNRLISFLLNKKTSIILENFQESNVIIDTFGRDRISKMELFVAYPFVISGKLNGFIMLFKINPAVNLIDIDIRVQKINRFLLPYLHKIFELDPDRNKFIDSTEYLFNRIEYDLKYAHDLNIPASILLITIKNFKRFYDRFGRFELKKLCDLTAEIIKKRLTGGDFSARIDRHKFLLVLPGKDKRYATMLSNVIKKEIMNNYNLFDFKLLISSNNALFPDEGKDIFTLLEILE